jgi:hypothetical protein
MGRGHGGSRGSGPGGGAYARNPELDTAYGQEQQRKMLETTFLLSPEISYRERLVDKKGYRGVTDAQMEAEIKDAITQYSKEIGLAEPTQFTIENTRATIGKKVVGASGFTAIALDKQYYGGSYAKSEKLARQRQESGFSVETSRPVRKTVQHELAHATYRYLSSESKAKVAQLYSRFTSDKSTKGWGSYSKTKAEEFYAEGIAKSLGGKKDFYTTELRKLTW